MTSVFYTVEESAKILGKSEATIKRMCAKGSLLAKKQGRDWCISKEDLNRRITLSYPIHEEDPKRELDTEQNLDELIENRKLSRVEAERLIKLEDVVKKRRENQQNDREVIGISLVLHAFEEAMFELVQNLTELTDHWVLKYHWSAEITREIRVDIQMALQRTERKLKSATSEPERD